MKKMTVTQMPKPKTVKIPIRTVKNPKLKLPKVVIPKKKKK